MRVENLLTIFGVLIVVAGYAAVIAALVDFDFVRTERNLYLLGGVGAVLWGTLLLGVAKAINQQLALVQQLDDIRRLVRAQAKAISDLRGTKSKTPATNAAKTPANTAKATPANAANSIPAKSAPGKPATAAPLKKTADSQKA
jgi:hypothetical protein